MIPVLLCGGSGTRLWPVSRSKMPKQFISLLEKSLFELSARRLEKLGRPYVVAIRDFEALTQTFATKLGLPSDHLISEPFARNTAPAVALICRYLELRGLESEVAGIFPADHVIADEKAFAVAVEVAVEQASRGGVVTLGIQPKEASTGFGYIEVESQTKSASESGVAVPKAVRSIRFREKPDLATAQEYVASGRYFWNAGIFFFRVSSMIAIFKKQTPEMWATLAQLKPDLSNLEAVYAKLPSISFDYAIMEHLTEQYCVPCDLGWSDLGSWDDVVDFANADDSPMIPNRAQTFSAGSENCFAYSERDHTIAFVDVKDVIAIETPDATLIYKRGSSQNVKHIVDQMKKAGRLEVEEHDYEVRPWGRLELLEHREKFAAKLASVLPGQTILSTARTTRVDETWTVVSGEARLEIGSDVRDLKKGSHISVPAKDIWKLTVTGSQTLELVEVHT